MIFTGDEYIQVGSPDGDAADKISKPGNEASVEIYSIPEGSPSKQFEASDCQVVIKYFEVESSKWNREDYALVNHYRDVYSTSNFSQRVREQMSYYPGMHSAGPGGLYNPTQDPFQKHAQQMGDETLNYWDNALSSPESFMAGLKGRQADIDYREMFKGDAGDVASNIASAVAECIPCFDRIFDGAQLLPDGNLLEVHLLNIKLRTDLLDQLRSLFSSPGFNIDICELLDHFAHLCPQDLLALLALFTQYLAKLNLDFQFNLDLIIELIGPLLSPFLDALTEWLDKWVQMILAPILCIIDNINMTIYIAQQFKLPLAEAQVNLDYHAGVSAPNILENLGGFSQAQSNSGIHLGMDDKSKAEYDPFIHGHTNNEAFNVPDSAKYNPQIPLPPEEEIELARAQIREDVGKDKDPTNYYDSLSVEERQAMWDRIKAEHWRRKNVDLSPPLRPADPRDGTKWSPNNIPLSEKAQWSKSFGGGYDTTAHPPENQPKPKAADEYYIDAGPLVDPIIQMRNIAVAGIRYVQDWFEWATQMIYDLIGTEFGWMMKKSGNTMLKSRLIQLILMIKAILEAVAKNGLQCGINTNFNSDHLKFILEDVISKVSPYKFKARSDGSFELITPGDQAKAAAGISEVSEAAKKAALGETPPEDTPEQKALKSGIIIKDCLKKVRASEVNKVREWIADFERRSDG